MSLSTHSLNSTCFGIFEIILIFTFLKLKQYNKCYIINMILAVEPDNSQSIWLRNCTLINTNGYLEELIFRASM